MTEFNKNAENIAKYARKNVENVIYSIGVND